MKPDQLRTILRQTLDDFHMSRSERRALGSRLEEAGLNAGQRAEAYSLAFTLARETMNSANPPDVLDWLEAVCKVLRAAVPVEADDEAVACFSPGDSCRSRISGLLRGTRNRVDICVFTITDDRITDEILAAQRRNVAVRVITDNDKALDRGSDAERLSRAGVDVRVDRTENHMHHKFALFDEKRLLTGSYNWTVSAARHNEENLIVTDDRSLVVPFAEEFERLWNRCDAF